MIKVMFLFLLAGNSGNGSFSTHELIVQISNVVADKFLTRCTIYIYSDNATQEEERRTFQMAKMFSDNFVYSKTTRVMTFDQFLNQAKMIKANRFVSDRCSKMLHVINGVDINVKTQLEKVRC